jgi:hypothetical protein
MTKIKMLAAAVAVASVSTLAGAADAPGAPSQYDTGPLSPIVNQTNLTVHERAAYAMLEAVLQMTEGKIHADGCKATSLPLKVYSDAGGQNDASLGSFGNNVKVVASVAPATFRGQKVTTVQNPAVGTIAATPVGNFSSTMSYNDANNMMTGSMSVDVLGANGQLNQFTGLVIKDFYKGTGPDQYLIFDWGLQSLSKLGYPVEKYWQRSKVRRDDGGIGRTVFVKDRLVGNTACRITIDLSGANGPSLYWQEGTLAIAQVAPAAPVPEFGVDFP